MLDRANAQRYAKDTQFSYALVTGASSGIGAALARKLAREGISMTISGRDAERLELLARELRDSHKIDINVLAADLALASGRQALVREIEAKEPDLLINNAGSGLYGDLVTQQPEQLEEMVGVDIAAVVALTQAAGRALLSSGREGVILNVASAAGWTPFPGMAVYAASKSFVISFSKAVDWEMARKGVRVLCSCPGVVETRFRQRSGAAQTHLDYGEQPMAPAYAANEIWRQVCQRRRQHTFGWTYRLMGFCARYLAPWRLLAPLLHRRIIRLRG